MLLKCHHHLHLLLEFKSGIADQGVHENYNLVIF
jgi:transcriptional antiterminator Rof (Rho-off)